MARSVSEVSSYEVDVESSGSVETLEIETTIQDQLRWETNNGGDPWLGGGAPSFTKLLETCYYAGRRLRLIEERQFDRWKRTVVDLRVPDGEDDEDDEGGESSDDGEPATFP